jgi:hypothetical protein
MPRILKKLLLIISGIAAVYIVFAGILAWQLRTITDVSQYDNLLARWEPTSVNHFPAAVPTQAAKVRLSYFPGFLQGGAHLQLRAEFPLDRIAAEGSQLLNSAIAKIVGGELFPFVPNIDHIQDMPSPPFYTADQGAGIIFPDDYTIFVLSARDGDTAWNHGHTKGVSISHTRAELVYWVESW